MTACRSTPQRFLQLVLKQAPQFGADRLTRATAKGSRGRCRFQRTALTRAGREVNTTTWSASAHGFGEIVAR